MWIVRAFDRDYHAKTKEPSYYTDYPVYWDDTNGCWTEDKASASRRNKASAKQLMKLAAVGKPDSMIELEEVQSNV